MMIHLQKLETVDDRIHVDYLRKAYSYAMDTSDDPVTKNGALLSKDGRIVAYGSNRLPLGVEKRPERLQRPLKYSYIGHAERNAIYSAGRSGVATEGLTMYCPWFACTPCANAIIESGIKTVVGHKSVMEKTPEHWKEDVGLALEILRESGVKMLFYDGKLDDVEAMLNGEKWYP